MVLTSTLPGRALLIAGLVLIGLTACGRRGALQAPPDPAALAAAKAQPQKAAAVPGDEDDDEETTTTLPSPTPTPRSKGNRRAYTIPKEPFILDPLL